MLRRKVLDPVKLFLANDPAVDADNSDFDAYRETWDAAKIKIREGQQATSFTLVQLTDRQRDACHRCGDMIDKATLALRYGLIGVDNYFVEDARGNLTQLEQPKRVRTDLGEMISQEWMDSARFLLEEKFAIGGTILAITEARPPLR